MKDMAELQSKYDRVFWARGYFVKAIGNITYETVQIFLNEQAKETSKDDFRSTAFLQIKKFSIPLFEEQI